MSERKLKIKLGALSVKTVNGVLTAARALSACLAEGRGNRCLDADGVALLDADVGLDRYAAFKAIDCLKSALPREFLGPVKDGEFPPVDGSTGLEGRAIDALLKLWLMTWGDADVVQADLDWAIEKLDKWLKKTGPAKPAGDGAANLTGSKLRMTVAQANDKALKLAQKWRAGFFALSGRQQAKLIGCSWKTWRETPFYAKAQLKKPTVKQPKLASPKTESLTAGEAVTGDGDKDEVLNNLIAEQEADQEESPLDNDPPNRPRRIHFRKRL